MVPVRARAGHSASGSGCRSAVLEFTAVGRYLGVGARATRPLAPFAPCRGLAALYLLAGLGPTPKGFRAMSKPTKSIPPPPPPQKRQEPLPWQRPKPSDEDPGAPQAVEAIRSSP